MRWRGAKAACGPVTGLLLLLSAAASAQTDANPTGLGQSGNDLDACLAGPPSAVLAVCERAAPARPEDGPLWRALAMSYTANARYDDAIAVLSDLAERRPDDPAVHLDLAAVLGFIQRYDGAVEPVRTALRLDPDNLLAWRAAAVIYTHLKRDADALDALRGGAERGDALAMYDLALIHLDGLYGMLRDETAGLAWMRRAAEAEHLEALSHMVDAHLEGRWGLPADPAAAAGWARRERAIRQRDLLGDDRTGEREDRP